MNRFEGIKPSAGKIVGNSILALVLGVLHPLLLIIQIRFPAPLISLMLIFCAAMYGSAGMIPAMVLGLAAAASAVLMYGWVVGVVSLLLWIVPAVVIIRGMRKREAFFNQLIKGIVAAVAVSIIAVVSLTMIFGADLVAQFVDRERVSFEAQKTLIWQLLSPMISVEMTMERFAELYYSALNAQQLYFEYYLVANLVGGAIASACAATLWGNWKLAKRGLATAESYRGVSQWRLPSNTTWGLLLMLGAGFIASKIDSGVLQSTWYTVKTLCQLVFAIQFIGALERRVKNGAGYKARVVLITIMLITGYRFMAIMGGMSALFGSNGAAKPLIDKFKENTNGENR